MSVRTYGTPCFVVQCDNCGVHMGGGTEFDIGHWDSEEEARKFINDFDWHENPDKQVFCPACISRREWGDE